MALALDDYLDASRVFTPAMRRRMGDVEFVSEILAAMLEGPQDKKDDLNYFYNRYANWKEAERKKTKTAFVGVIQDLRKIFAEEKLPLRITRFRQKADFYSLFLAINDLRCSGHSLDGKDVRSLREDLRLLDQHIAPESSSEILREYAIKCVSQANSQGSRAWRRNFLTDILSGTYKARRPNPAAQRMFSDLLMQLEATGESTLFDQCIVCSKDISKHAGARILDWSSDKKTFQLSNAGWRGPRCKSK